MKHKEKFYTEEQKEIIKFGKILLSLVIIIGLLYLFTQYVVNKPADYKRTNNDGEVAYDSIILGTLLNKIDEEYYVLVLDKKNMNNDIFTTLLSQYKSSAKHLPIYTADLSNELNKGFISEESNYKEDSVEDLKVKGTTLIKVKKHKIVRFIESREDIINALS